MRAPPEHNGPHAPCPPPKRSWKVKTVREVSAYLLCFTLCFLPKAHAACYTNRALNPQYQTALGLRQKQSVASTMCGALIAR